jgi:Ubiquitin C-terminal hydrolase
MGFQMTGIEEDGVAVSDTVVSTVDLLADKHWQSHLADNQSILVDLFQGQFKSTVSRVVFYYVTFFQHDSDKGIDSSLDVHNCCHRPLRYVFSIVF